MEREYTNYNVSRREINLKKSLYLQQPSVVIMYWMSNNNWTLKRRVDLIKVVILTCVELLTVNHQSAECCFRCCCWPSGKTAQKSNFDYKQQVAAP